MQSSSRLFPVALVKADLWQGLSEDIYLLKPNNSSDKSVEISVTRLGNNLKSEGQVCTPIVLVHDLYQNRLSWMQSQSEDDFAVSLARSGFDVWLVEMRGHGMSKINQHYTQNSLDDFSAFDLVAVQQFIHEKNSVAAVWLGEGEGGISVLSSLAGEHMEPEWVQGVVVTRADRLRWRNKYRWPLMPTMTRLFNRKKVMTKSHLPETEPRGVWKQRIKTHSLIGSRKVSGNKKLLPSLKAFDFAMRFCLEEQNGRLQKRLTFNESTCQVLHCQDRSSLLQLIDDLVEADADLVRAVQPQI